MTISEGADGERSARILDGEWVAHLIACPSCHGPVYRSEERWLCKACGTVGRQILGFADFTSRSGSLPMAGGGEMDLSADEELASELHDACRRMTSSEVAELAGARRVAEQDRRSGSVRCRQARDRFNRNLARVDSEGRGAGGSAVVAKVDTKLDELGWPPLRGGRALEAGGGEGLYLPTFCSRFEQVVFVDASLANIVLAAAAAAELGLENLAFVRADVMALPFQSGAFDFVHQNGVIEHVQDPVRMTREAARVRSPHGYYVCVSPNRMAITREPHFGVPAFGFIPSRLRAVIVPLVRGLPLEEGGTDPRTLGQLRRYLEAVGEQESVIFFLPRRLHFTARNTPIRRLVRAALARPRLGDAVDLALNRLLLSVVPHHIALARVQQGVAGQRRIQNGGEAPNDDP